VYLVALRQAAADGATNSTILAVLSRRATARARVVGADWPAGGSLEGAHLQRDRWFESCSLQRRVKQNSETDDWLHPRCYSARHNATPEISVIDGLADVVPEHRWSAL